MERGERERRPHEGERRRVNPRLVVAVVAVALLVLFAALNSNEVSVDFVVTSRRAPLILVIVISAVLGALVGTLVQWVARRRD